MIQIWRVNTLVVIPRAHSGDTAVGETVKFQIRLPQQAKQYGDIAVALRNPANPEPNALIEQAELAADVPVPAHPHSHRNAIERFSPVITTLIDLMAFEMADGPGVESVEMIDITPPIAVGDERTQITFTTPPFDRYMRSRDVGTIRGRVVGELPQAVDHLDSKTAAVLRWFVKASDTEVLHDRFIFLWIALEILFDASDVHVEEPYRGRCGHQIPECPECGKPTTKLVRGASLKAFLQKYNVTAQQAKELWAMRQLMHGAIPFDSKKLENLGSLVQPLRAVVAAGLKGRLDKTANDLPIVAAEGLLIHPAMGVGSSRRVSDRDIRPLMDK